MIKEITPNLWFNGNAKEAVDFYLSVFPNSNINAVVRYPEEGLLDFQKELAGEVLTIDFTLSGKRFTAVNAGPEFTFNESISFVIPCDGQEEIDYYWNKLSTVPEAEQCGWCKDQYGLSWQVVPSNMEELMSRPNAFANMMQMKKLIISDF